ncbi:MAG TPA: hypothetical protein VFC63_23670, partial [Blastocatellia bacterium]|nr:hypothetical protein [Blastocatellia bacterium]
MDRKTLSPVLRFVSTKTNQIIRIIPFLFILLAVQSVAAQQSGPNAGPATSDDRETVKLLLKRIDELESRVKELEDKQAKTVAVNTSTAASADTKNVMGDKKDVTPAADHNGQATAQSGGQSGSQDGGMHDGMSVSGPNL